MGEVKVKGIEVMLQPGWSDRRQTRPLAAVGSSKGKMTKKKRGNLMAYTHDLLEETTGWLRRVCIDDKGKKTSIVSVNVCGSHN